MQAVIAIPSGFREVLAQDVAGVLLLIRVLATARRAGVNQVLLLWPADANPAIWEQCAASPTLRGLEIRKLESFPFDPRKNSSWSAICALLDEEFLWLPWNFVTSARILAAIEPSPAIPLSWARPERLSKELIRRSSGTGVTAHAGIDGVSIGSLNDVPRAERFLVAKSGKATDGIYSNFNRKLSRPFVRALTHTAITPNIVTLAGLLVAIVSASMYAKGSYWEYVAGAILFSFQG